MGDGTRPPLDRSAERTFPIVGIGASAGGLEATTELLKHLPADTGMAFVVVQHLDPARKSALTELLGRATALPVEEATDGTAVRQDRVYVIPPGFDMTLERGELRLTQRQPSAGGRRSIDLFFESLAADHGASSIGVVLSGTATDGTVGLEAIKAEGGLTFAQDESAKYPSMPQSAFAAGFADASLSPARIAEELVKIAAHHVAHAREGSSHAGDAPPNAAARSESSSNGGRADDDEAEEGALAAQAPVLSMLREHTGIDFTLYKPSTVTRRLRRRMMINQVATLPAYEQHLRKKPSELSALHDDMLITLTGFFRNPAAFEALKATVLTKLSRVRREAPIRAWVAGCSTGQEAYSVVMAYVEATDGAPQAPRLQVFATDVSLKGVEGARSGLYPRSALGEMTPDRIQRFFEEEDSGWFRIRKSVRERVVFAHHDILRSPPFSHLDLVTCRNLLIYLKLDAQRRIFTTFARALEVGGFLFLGASESPASLANAFVPLDEKHRIFERTSFEVPVDLRGFAAYQGGSPDVTALLARSGRGAETRDLGVQRAADRVVANQYAPNGVVVDSSLQVVEVRGDPQPWLKLPTGRATFDVRRLIHDDLASALRSAIRTAKTDKRPTRRGAIRVAHAERTHSVFLEVAPLRHQGQDYFLVSLGEDGEKVGPVPATGDVPVAAARRGRAAKKDGTTGARSMRAERRRNADLERDLSEVRDDARTLRQDHDAIVEELSSASERAMSANEELQSLNEEMEAAKEELESANEELSTVNDEMLKQNATLARMSSDLANTERVAALMIVIVDQNAVLRRFTPAAGAHFSIRASDLGRRLDAISGLPPALAARAEESLAQRAAHQLEVQDQGRRWLEIRITPYEDLSSRIEGAVISFLDIDAQKRRDEVVREAREFADAIIRTMRDGLLVLDADMHVVRVNDAFCTLFRTTSAVVLGRRLWDLSAGQWNTPVLHNRFDDMVSRNSTFDGLEVTHDVPGLGRRTFLVGSRTLREPGADASRILVSIRDITEALQFQVRERADVTLYRRVFETSPDGMLIAHARTGEVREANLAMAGLVGCALEELLRLNLSELSLSASDGPLQIDLEDLYRKGLLHIDACRLTSRAGDSRTVEVRMRVHHDVVAPLLVVNVRARSDQPPP